MTDPTPVDVKNAEPIKVEVTGTDGKVQADPPKPTIAKTTETHETITTSGDAAQTSAVQMGARFDDWVRAGLAYIVVLQFTFTIIYGQWTGHEVRSDQFTIDVGIVMLALGFYFGSSYGRNLDKKASI